MIPFKHMGCSLAEFALKQSEEFEIFVCPPPPCAPRIEWIFPKLSYGINTRMLSSKLPQRLCFFVFVHTSTTSHYP
jgi:hypothetical protein